MHDGLTPELDLAIARAVHDQADGVLQDLLAAREDRREQADPARLIRRLTAQAAALEARAEGQAERAAEFFGKAAYRRQRGDIAAAADFQRRAFAAESVGADFRGQAFALRLRADRTAARLADAAALCSIALSA